MGKLFGYYKLECNDLDVIRETLTKEQGFDLICALVDYSRDGTITELPAELRIPFAMLKKKVDQAHKVYEDKCNTLKENGRKGGKAKAQNREQVTGSAPAQARKFKPPTLSQFKNAVKKIAEDNDFDDVDNYEIEAFFDSLNERTWNLEGMTIQSRKDWEEIIYARFHDTLSYEYEGLYNSLGVSGSGMKDVLTPMLQGITNELNKYVEFMGFMKEDDTLVEEFSAAELAAQSTAATVQQLRLEYDQAKEAAHQALLAQVGYFDELSAKSDKSATDIVANWGKQKEAFDQYAANLEKAVQLGLDETLVAQLSDGSEQSMAILNELVNSTDLNIDEINKAFEEVQESRDTVESTMADIKEDMSGKLAEMAGEVETEWGEMAGTVGESIAEMQGYIDGLKGKDVYVNVITRNIGGTSAPKGSVESTLTPNAVSFASVPFLASGAVIPPNAPFTAVLGDQKHGTNIEAPLSTIQEAVAQVIGDLAPAMAAGFEAMAERQDELISTVRDIQIGDTTIGRAAARYDRRQNLIRGGTTG